MPLVMLKNERKRTDMKIRNAWIIKYTVNQVQTKYDRGGGALLKKALSDILLSPSKG